MTRLAALGSMVASLAFAVAPAAAALIDITATDNGVALVVNASSPSPGNVVATITDPFFSDIAIDVTGTPAVASPNLGTVTLQVSGANAAGHTLDVTATQSGLAEPAGEDGTLTQTWNNLIGAPGPGTENFFINGGLAAAHTFDAQPPRTDEATFTLAGLPAITSNAQEFIATFTAPQQDLEMTQEFLATPAAVPEPTSLALLSAALLAGLAMLWGLAMLGAPGGAPRPGRG